MRRTELTRIAVILMVGTCLVLWLVYATRPEAQIHALEVHPARAIPSPVDPPADQSAIENSIEETENASFSNETPSADVVTGRHRAAARRIRIENVPGPEPLPGL